MDSELQALERAVAASPTDEVVRERLEQAQLRLDRFHDGTPNRPAKLEFRREGRDRVYSLLPWDLDMVLVKGGVTPCSVCTQTWTHGECHFCKGTNRVVVKDFLLGRVPTTFNAWQSCTADFGAIETFDHTIRYRPITYLRHKQVANYCSHYGLRLPTRHEWLWAAIRADPTERGDFPCPGADQEGHEYCPRCGGSGRIHPLLEARTFPWSDRTRNDGATLDHTAALDVRYRGIHAAPVYLAVLGPVPNLRIARPLGRSWCGAYDLIGNVHQMVDDGTAWGGSVHTPIDELRTTGPGRFPRGDVGFRVAMTIPEA